MISSSLTIKNLPCQDYLTTWQAMQLFTLERNEATPDEIWFLEHPPVFTQGQNGKPEHVLNPGTIPIVKTDRGGQITYHGPGQCVVYLLIDLKRRKITIRDLVTQLENSIIELLAEYDIKAQSKREAPGVYINSSKICSIGLRVKRGCTYHGIALNVNMDLEPFLRINPCGFSNLKMTQMADHTGPINADEMKEKLIQSLKKNLGYNVSPAMSV